MENSRREEEFDDNQIESQEIEFVGKKTKMNIPIEKTIKGRSPKSVIEGETTAEHVNNQKQEFTDFIGLVQKDLEIRNERDKYKDEAIQRMSAQIADFEKGVFEKIKKGLINEVISFYDLLLTFREKFKALENKELQNEMGFLETEISNILFNNSVEEIEETLGQEVNRDFHKVKEKIETNEIKENRIINKVLKKGFVLNGMTLRKQEVVVFEYGEKDSIDE